MLSKGMLCTWYRSPCKQQNCSPDALELCMQLPAHWTEQAAACLMGFTSSLPRKNECNLTARDIDQFASILFAWLWLSFVEWTIISYTKDVSSGREGDKQVSLRIKRTGLTRYLIQRAQVSGFPWACLVSKRSLGWHCPKDLFGFSSQALQIHHYNNVTANNTVRLYGSGVLRYTGDDL